MFLLSDFNNFALYNNFEKFFTGLLFSETKHPAVTPAHTHTEDSVDSVSHSTVASTATEHYRLGFQECLSETMHFLVEVEGFFARDSLCVQLINHLQQHCEKILATSKYKKRSLSDAVMGRIK